MQGRRAYAVWIGAALLTITALFHLTGYFQIPAIQRSTREFFAVALRPLWLFASLHWLLTAAVCVMVTKAVPRVARPILFCCAAVVIADAVLLYRFIGPFIGVATLAGAGLAIVIGAYRHGGDPEADMA